LREALQAHIAVSCVVPDEADVIEKTLKNYSERHVDLIFTVGGTGIAARDVTPEATHKVIDRELPGLAEVMRATSAQQTPHAWLSRALVGVYRATLIVNLPGSLRGATENLRAILSLLPHTVKMLRGDTAHPENDRARQVTLTNATHSAEPRP
jgi:molybdenum cofactor synthesis domain-containing protein